MAMCYQSFSSFVFGRLSGLLLFPLFGCFLAGCGPSGSDSPDGPQAFIFARGADAQKLDPADIDDGESVNTLAQIMEGLLRFKPGSLEVEPWLASSYNISEDGLSYTFHLREGVRFHDGTPLTAETARFSFIRQMDPEHPAHFRDASFQYWQNLFRAVAAVEVVDAMTLRFQLSRPDAGILYALASFPAWLVSPAGLERMGDQMVYHPIGTGPYRFVSWRPGEAVLLERNADYWHETKAGFERLVLRSVPLNASRLSELKAGRIHGLDGLQPSEIRSLENDERFEVYHEPGLNVGYLAFSSQAEALADPEIRGAIAMAIDRENLVLLALDGYGKVADYPMPPGFLGIPEGDAPISFNPDKAREILQRHPQILEQTITLATFGQPRMYFPDPQRVASLIRSDLQAVGLKVEIINREFRSHLHISRRGEFDMALLGWIADTPDPDNFMSTFFHSKAAVVGSATNISLYRNEAMDSLLDQGVTLTDPAKRAEIYEQALSIWAKDLPLIPLVHGEQITVLRREIENYQLHPVGIHYFGPVKWQRVDPEQ
jgi:peptide/nickel transport system substrate-binding protein